MASNPGYDQVRSDADGDSPRPKVTLETQRRLAAMLLRGKLDQEHGAHRATSAPPGKLTFGETVGHIRPPTSADSDFPVNQSSARSPTSTSKQLLRLGSLGFDRASANAASPTRRSAGDKTPRHENGPGRAATQFNLSGVDALALAHPRVPRDGMLRTASGVSPQLHSSLLSANTARGRLSAFPAFSQGVPVSAPHVSPLPVRRKGPVPSAGAAAGFSRGSETRVPSAHHHASALAGFADLPVSYEKGVAPLVVRAQRSPGSAFTDFGEFPVARADDAELGGLRRLRAPRAHQPDYQPHAPSVRDQAGHPLSGQPYSNQTTASPLMWDSNATAITPTLGDRAFWLDKFVPPERPKSTPPLSLYQQEQLNQRLAASLGTGDSRDMNARFLPQSLTIPSAAMMAHQAIQASRLQLSDERLSSVDPVGYAEQVLSVRRREHSYHEGYGHATVASAFSANPERTRQQRHSADYPSTVRGQHPQESLPASTLNVVVNAPVSRQKSPISVRRVKSPALAVPEKFADQCNAVLEDFRTNKGRQYELSDFAGFVAQFAADQNGSRAIQQKLERATDEEKAATINEILPYAVQLATDPFGNYVMQKLFEFGSNAQRVSLAEKLDGHVLTLTLHMYGCRVIQKALEHLPRTYQLALLREIQGDVVECVKDQNGNHVIQKAVDLLPSDDIPFIFDAFLGQVGHLSAHTYGCRVVQRILVCCQSDVTRNRLMDELYQLTTALAVDQFGNYVVQNILEHGTTAERAAVIARVKPHISALSTHKYASNVVEKCLAYGSRQDRHALIEEVIAPLPDGGCELTRLMKDKFANYVVQRILDIVAGDQRTRILEAMVAQLPALRKIPHGKHIISKLEKLARSMDYPLPQALQTFGSR